VKQSSRTTFRALCAIVPQFPLEGYCEVQKAYDEELLEHNTSGINVETEIDSLDCLAE
jgi:hypothetical protein